MILDLHLHSELSDDSRAPVEAYLKLLQRKRAERPLDGIALTCHPGRPTVGLCAHYETKPPLHGVVAVEAINGGSRKGEDERVEELIRRYGYQAYGGSDSHLVSFVGICATEFEAEIRSIEDLVRELKGGRYRP